MFKKLVLPILFLHLQSLSSLMAMEEQKSMGVYGTKSPDPSELIQKQLLLGEIMKPHRLEGQKDMECEIMKPLIAISLTTEFSFPSVEFVKNRLGNPKKSGVPDKFIIDGINFWLFCNGGNGMARKEMKLLQIRNLSPEENSFGICATYSDEASDYSCLAYIEAISTDTKSESSDEEWIHRSKDYSFELTTSQTAKGTSRDNIYWNIGKESFVDIYPEDVIFKIVRKI